MYIFSTINKYMFCSYLQEKALGIVLNEKNQDITDIINPNILLDSLRVRSLGIVAYGKDFQAQLDIANVELY